MRIINTKYKWIHFFCLTILSSCSTSAAPPNSLPLASDPAPQIEYSEKDLKGWKPWVEKLVALGVDRPTLMRTLKSPQMPSWEVFTYKLEPKESHYQYKQLNSASNRNYAINWYKPFHQNFCKAEAQFNIPRSMILALLTIETGCGRNMGKISVFPKLIRLASATHPEIIQESIERHLKEEEKSFPPAILRQRFQLRAQYLEDTFLPQAAAAFTLAKSLGLEPLELRGSSAGALGFGQFLPGSFLKYGIDGNGDGKRDPFSAVDMIPSIANFLHSYGYKRGSIYDIRKALWEYNRSEAYQDTAIAIADLYQKALPACDKNVVITKNSSQLPAQKHAKKKSIGKKTSTKKVLVKKSTKNVKLKPPIKK
jgi:membrane-bound lytic murein transglycosylase B